MGSVEEKKEIAIKLRKKGYTYGEIFKETRIVKSTLSYWLRDVRVPQEFHNRLLEKKLAAVQLGWEARRKQRIDRTAQISELAKKEVARLILNPLWVTGVALYWAEGHKEKTWRLGIGVTFTNMDENTILIFLHWCKKFLNVEDGDFIYNLYIHDSRSKDSQEMKDWWARELRVTPERIVLYYKKSAKTHVRHNDGDSYHGVFRVRVRKSVDMNRRIAAWTSGLLTRLNTKME